MLVNKYDWTNDIIDWNTEVSPEEREQVKKAFADSTFKTRTIEFFAVDEFEPTRISIVGTQEDFEEYLEENEIIKYTLISEVA